MLPRATAVLLLATTETKRNSPLVLQYVSLFYPQILLQANHDHMHARVYVER